MAFDDRGMGLVAHAAARGGALSSARGGPWCGGDYQCEIMEASAGSEEDPLVLT